MYEVFCCIEADIRRLGLYYNLPVFNPNSMINDLKKIKECTLGEAW